MVQLVMGLGNPGTRYADTRHNVGFHCVQEIARRLDLEFSAVHADFLAAVGDGPAGPLTLMLPQTYMNRSGRALRTWSRLTGLSVSMESPEAVDGLEDHEVPRPDVTPVVVCDDIQLTLGSVRIRGRGSDGGQNGLADILEVVGTRDVPRLRLGVGPLRGELDPADWADYVLAPFADDDAEAVAGLIGRGSDALLDLLEHGPELAGSRHNRRIRPEPDLPPGP